MLILEGDGAFKSLKMCLGCSLLDILWMHLGPIVRVSKATRTSLLFILNEWDYKYLPSTYPIRLRAFCFFLMHLTIHPYSKLRKVLNGFEGSACDKPGTVCQPARSRGTPSTERATCLGPGDVGGSTKRCRHLRLDKSHWQTICHSVTASITDQKHQWQCKGHSMKAMGIPRWTCNDVLTFFVLSSVKWNKTRANILS